MIKADGSSVMTAAPEHVGMLTARDGQWKMESLQEIFAGAYEIDGEDSFSTTGDITARWTRVMEGQAPDGIDPDFLKIRAQVPPGSTPVGTVESQLIGLWQATPEGAASPTILVWRIPAAGFAALTEVVTASGQLSAENGKMTMNLDNGSTIATDYLLQGPDAFITTDESGRIRWQRRGTGVVPD